MSLPKLKEGVRLAEALAEIDSPLVVAVAGSDIWCPQCRQLEPTLEKLPEQFDERQVKFVKIDVDHPPEAPEVSSIQSVPFMLAYRQGESVAAGKILNGDHLRELVAELVA